jgi:hypothetical protein
MQLFSLPILFFQGFFYAKFGVLNLLPYDINNHAQISFFMREYGFESKFAELSSLKNSVVPKRTPYHYAELWLNVFFTHLLPNSKVGYTLIYVTYPFCYTIFFSGLYMLGKLCIENRYVVYLLAILGLFLGPLDLNFFREIFFEDHLLSNQTVVFENIGFFFNTIIYSYNGQKHIPFYILSVLIIYFFHKSEVQKAFVFIPVAILLNIGTLPAVFGSTLLFAIYHYYTAKNIKKSVSLIMPMILMVLFILIYYRVNGGFDSENQTSLLFLNPELNFKGVFLKVVLRGIYTTVFLCLIYFPFILFLRKLNTKLFTNSLFIFVSSLLITGLFTRFILEGFNTAQFLTVLLPFFNVYLVYLCLKFYKTNKVLIVVIMVLIFGVNLISTKFHTQTRRDINVNYRHSQNFIENVYSLLAKHKRSNIGYLLGQKDYKENKPGFWYGFYPCEFLFLNDHFNFYSLNFPNYKYSENSTKSNDFSPNHLRYFMSKNISERQYEKLLVPFIQLQKIHFIACAKDSKLPETVRIQICDSIIDIRSGDKFYSICN